MSILPQKKEWFILASLAAIALFGAFWSPEGGFTATPKYWWDESFAVETARTIIEQGRIDITVAPHTPSDKAITLNANGFPLTLSLAAVYSIFGIGIVQTRLLMIVWILGALALTYLFWKKLFGTHAAIAGILLIITFASFWANGRTATGDIPSFVFLIGGLWLLSLRQSFFWGGVALGLAAITKTSVMHMVLPAAAFAVLWHYRKEAILPLIRITLGGLLVGIAWFLLLLPQPYSLADIQPGIDFYRNPTNKPSLIARLPESIFEISSSSTLIYFALIAIITFIALRHTKKNRSQALVLAFVVFYATLQTIVFLRSPGWTRYLIAIELLLLLLIYPALEALRVRRVYIVGGIACLAILQMTQYLFFSNIFSIPQPTRIADAIHRILEANPGSTVGFVNNPMTAAWIPGDRKYQIVRVGGDTYAGTHPLELPPEQMPTFMVSPDDAHKYIIDSLYEPVTIDYDYVIYRKR